VLTAVPALVSITETQQILHIDNVHNHDAYGIYLGCCHAIQIWSIISVSFQKQSNRYARLFKTDNTIPNTVGLHGQHTQTEDLVRTLCSIFQFRIVYVIKTTSWNVITRAMYIITTVTFVIILWIYILQMVVVLCLQLHESFSVKE